MGEQILHVDQADHMVDVAIAERKPRIAPLLHGAEHLAERLIQREKIDAARDAAP